MIRQRLTLVGGYPGGVWSCAACGSELSDGTISHRDDCRWVAEIREAERARILCGVGDIAENWMQPGGIQGHRVVRVTRLRELIGEDQ